MIQAEDRRREKRREERRPRVGGREGVEEGERTRRATRRKKGRGAPLFLPLAVFRRVFCFLDVSIGGWRDREVGYGRAGRGVKARKLEGAFCVERERRAENKLKKKVDLLFSFTFALESREATRNPSRGGRLWARLLASFPLSLCLSLARGSPLLAPQSPPKSTSWYLVVVDNGGASKLNGKEGRRKIKKNTNATLPAARCRGEGCHNFAHRYVTMRSNALLIAILGGRRA